MSHQSIPEMACIQGIVRECSIQKIKESIIFICLEYYFFRLEKGSRELKLKWPWGALGPYHSFSHILPLLRQIFGPVLFVIITLMETLWRKKKKKKKKIGPGIFSVISIKWAWEVREKMFLSIKSHRNKNFPFLFQQ